MNARHLARFRKRLLDLRAELLSSPDARVEPTRSHVSEKFDEDASPLTEMSQIIASNRNRTRAAALEKIDRALERLDEEPDDFGLCRICEDEIAEKRLLAMPYVELCVDCQSARDPARGAARKHLTDYDG